VLNFLGFPFNSLSSLGIEKKVNLPGFLGCRLESKKGAIAEGRRSSYNDVYPLIWGVF
jgi:hypothetical protein